MHINYWYFPILFLLGNILPLSATNETTEQLTTIFQKLQDYDEIILTTNLDSLILNKRTDRYQPAKAIFTSSNKSALEMDIHIRARGKFRRRTCELPPIKLNFAKSDLKSMGLVKNYDKLKLVTHCQLEKNYEQHLLKEYWAYKMYNEVTAASYQVRLLKIRYIHETDPSRTISSYAILLESAKELAERLGGELIQQSYGMTKDKLTASSYDQTIFFNYMIGNTDWELKVQRNLTLVQIDGTVAYTVIPYDFDQSKLVNAPYLAKHPSIQQVRMDNRHAMGELSSETALQELIGNFKGKKGSFKEYKNCAHLKKKIKGEITSFLNTFYVDLGDRTGMRTEFLAGK